MTSPARDDSLRHVRSLLDAINCGAILLDRSGRILHANPRMAALLSRPAPEIVGRHTADFYSDPEALGFVRDRMLDFDSPFEGEFYLPRPDGERVPVIVSGRPLGVEAPLSDYKMVTFIDISGQKQAEERLKEEYTEISRLSDTVLEQALALKRYSGELEERVRERTADLRQANMEAIYMLAVASEAKDIDTGVHVRRIQGYTQRMARALGLPENRVDEFGYSAILHDVGKMQVPDRILKKPGALTGDERTEMEVHTIAGERILSRQPFFEVAREIARSHHENWDGSGYPDGRRRDEIPLAARIVHLVDVFDALTSERVYKAAWPVERAVAAILAGRGTQFEPELVRVFEGLHADGSLRGILSGREAD